MNPNFHYTEKIFSLTQDISKMEGELQGLFHSFKNEEGLLFRANVEAVHFSTKIEGNQLSLKQVTGALEGAKIKVAHQRDLREVLNYSKARALVMERALQERACTLNLIFKLHELLLNGIVKGKLKGHFREAQNVIKDSKSMEIVYLPPEWKEVTKMMKDLISWSNKVILENKSPLVVAAIFHYEFVTIHPFVDGNGRLARLLSNFFLLSNKFSGVKYAALEKQHEKNRSKYYLSLRSLQGETFYDIPRDIDLSNWIEYWLECLKKTYEEALERVKNIPSPPIQGLRPRLESAMSFFFKHKKLKAKEYESIMGIARTQAVSDLKELMELKLIKKVGGGAQQFTKLFQIERLTNSWIKAFLFFPLKEREIPPSNLQTPGRENRD